MLGRWVATRAHVGGEGAHPGGHLVLQVGIALDEARAESVADPQQVVEDEHLAVGRGPGADADDRDLDARHQQLGDVGRDRLEDDREASGLLQRERVGGDACRGVRVASLGAVAAQRGGRLRGQADVAHHRDAGADDRSCASARGGSAALELDRVAAGILDEAQRRAHRLLVGDLVRAEWKVADEKRRPQPAPHGAREHEHLVEVDADGRRVAQHGHGARVADEDHVDAGLLGGARTREVVGGDHDDRVAAALHLGHAWQGDRQAVDRGGRRDLARMG